ncbi:MAG: hypothetical protein WC823_07365 [Parcubacteria group bacterium]
MHQQGGFMRGAGFMCWGKNKHVHRAREQFPNSSQIIDTGVMRDVLARQKNRSIATKIAMNEKKGLHAGCRVRMLKTGSKRIIDHISVDGGLLMEGATIPCSHTDCELIQDET